MVSPSQVCATLTVDRNFTTTQPTLPTASIQASYPCLGLWGRAPCSQTLTAWHNQWPILTALWGPQQAEGSPAFGELRLVAEMSQQSRARHHDVAAFKRSPESNT